MDLNNTLISSAISIGTYIIYKIAQRYYIRSGCHNKTLELTIVDKEEIELTQVTSQHPVVEQEPSSSAPSSSKEEPSH